MDDEEMLFKQVQMTTAATKGTTVWVYRNTVSNSELWRCLAVHQTYPTDALCPLCARARACARACVSVVSLAPPQVYGYPWYADVRKTLEDPAYAVSPQRLFD